MKTIEERAKAFCENNICVDCGDRKNCDRGCVGCSISTYSSLYEALIVIIHYEDEKRNYVLRRVSELKRKRK